MKTCQSEVLIYYFIYLFTPYIGDLEKEDEFDR